MLFKTPKFWLEKNFITTILVPLSFIYNALLHFNEKKKISQKVNKKVICIGNLSVGGSGKTPVALAFGKILQEMQINFVYLSRGYRGKKKYSGFVDKNRSFSHEIGDEPLLLADVAPTFVAKNRLAAAREIALMSKFKAIILDDGMQNSSLKKDLTVLVVDGKIKFGNGFLFPAGPLRESISSGLKKTDFVIVIGKIDDDLQKTLAGKEVVSATVKAKNLDKFQGHKLLAFCGIAYPQKFFSFAKDSNLNIVATKSFVDHHFYKISELNALLEEAKKKNAKLITTKKDWIKFPANFKRKIEYLDIELEFEDKEFIKSKLNNLLC